MKYAVAFVAGAALAASAVFAWPQETRRPHGISAHYAELGLSADQSTRIEPLLRQLEERVGPLCRSVAQHRRDLYGELRKDAPDPARVDGAIDAMIAARRDMQRVVVEHLAAVKPLLTPEQRSRLFDRLSADRR